MLTNSRDTTDEDTGDFSPASNDSSLSMIDLQPSIGKDADHMDTNSAKTTSPIPNQHVYYTDSEWDSSSWTPVTTRNKKRTKKTPSPSPKM
mmetsp:Transcript_94730/g.192576  ORF Transcript_94730/g.192576 Transcript_94730/m.192576 type:complete len:91 (+) Transcript_94730:631-903(+)